MKKIILFFLFSFLCFSQEKTIEAFFQEYNYDCENAEMSYISTIPIERM